ncbi:M20/M25/M40 family metallo-hydrolase [Peribacillus sp. NPDC060186]
MLLNLRGIWSLNGIYVLMILFTRKPLFLLISELLQEETGHLQYLIAKNRGRMGVAPNENVEDAQHEIDECLQQLSILDPWFKDNPPVLEWFGARRLTGEIHLEHDLMNTLVHQYRETTGEEPVIEASPWGTDGGLLTEVEKIPTFLFGPGTTEMSHFPDEYIELDEVFKSAEIIALTIIQ